MRVKFRLVRYADWWVKLQHREYLFWEDIGCISDLAEFLRKREYRWPEPALQGQWLCLNIHSVPKKWSNNNKVCRELVRYVEEIWNNELEDEEKRKRKLRERDMIEDIIY